MDSFFSRYKNGLVLGLVLLAQVIGLAVQVRRPVPNAPDGRGVRLLRYWMISVIGPPERIAHATGLGIRGIWSNYIDLRHVRQRNRQLQGEIDRLRLEQAGLAEDARQGHRLQQLLTFKEKYIYQTVAAQVIGTSGSDMSRILILDKGSRDGLAVDMPVITPDGIVGKIREVFPRKAQVLEISDPSSGAGVMLETTRIRGVLRGNAFGQPQIINILPDDRIQPGERVLTSGGDQVYPRGLTVGYVEKVVNDPERNPYIDILIKSAATLSRLEEVLVITSTGDTIPPGEAKDVAQSEVEASRHGAADELANKLPTLADPNDAGANAQAAAEAATGEGDVARPVRPATALHPDRFTPGTTPDANALTPAAAMPHPPHNPPAAPAANSAPLVKRTPAAGTAETGPTSIMPTSPAKTAPRSITPTSPAKTAPTTSKPASIPGQTPGSTRPAPSTAPPRTAPPGDPTHKVVVDGPGTSRRSSPAPVVNKAPGATPNAARPGAAPSSPPSKPKTAPSSTPAKPKPAPPSGTPTPQPVQPQGGR